MLSVVSRMPEVVAFYPRQAELEDAISKIVQQQQGVKETDLWIMALAAMATGPNRPSPCIVAAAVQRMLRQGKLVGVDYTISDCANTFILPPGTHPIVHIPIRMEKPYRGLRPVD